MRNDTEYDTSTDWTQEDFEETMADYHNTEPLEVWESGWRDRVDFHDLLHYLAAIILDPNYADHFEASTEYATCDQCDAPSLLWRGVYDNSLFNMPFRDVDTAYEVLWPEGTSPHQACITNCPDCAVLPR